MRYFTLIMFIMLSLSAYSQNRSKRPVKHDAATTESQLYKKYADSLSIYRQRLDSVMRENIALKESGMQSIDPDSRYMRLFTPVTFHPDLARRRFSFHRDDSFLADNQYVIDNALMNIYFRHPDKVHGLSNANPSTSAGVQEKPKQIKTTPIYVPVDNVGPEEANFEPVGLMIKKPNFWTYRGENYLQIMQNYYSANWYQGGESNYSLLGRITLEANYNNKQKLKFENKLEMQLGFQTNKSDSVHSVKTSSDLLRYTGKLGLQATKQWYYTLQLVANSQFMRSFASNSHKVNSDFLSPLNVNLSLGMDYTMNWIQGRLKGSIHIAPIAMNYKYVDRLDLAPRNGIDAGSHSKVDLGSTFTIDAAWKLNDNISWKSRLYGYTTYRRTELQWENIFDLKISRVIAMSIYVYPRFDDSNTIKDDDLGYFQLKEYTSLGLTYSF